MKASRLPLTPAAKLAQRGLTYQDVQRINEARRKKAHREAALLAERMARDRDPHPFA
jgi:hypothetical protein